MSIDKELIRELYVEDELAINKIADIVGVSKRQVNKVVKELGIVRGKTVAMHTKRKGSHLPKEHRENISKTMKELGLTRSFETRKKISETLRGK